MYQQLEPIEIYIKKYNNQENKKTILFAVSKHPYKIYQISCKGQGSNKTNKNKTEMQTFYPWWRSSSGQRLPAHCAPRCPPAHSWWTWGTARGPPIPEPRPHWRPLGRRWCCWHCWCRCPSCRPRWWWGRGCWASRPRHRPRPPRPADPPPPAVPCPPPCRVPCSVSMETVGQAMDHHHRHLCSYCMQVFCLFVLFTVLKKEEVICRWLALNTLSFQLFDFNMLSFLFSCLTSPESYTSFFSFFFHLETANITHLKCCHTNQTTVELLAEITPKTQTWPYHLLSRSEQDTTCSGSSLQADKQSLHLSDQQEDTLGPLKTTFPKTILHAPSCTCSTPFHSHTHTMTQSRCDARKTTCQNDITGVCASTKPDPKKQTDMPLSLILFKHIGNTLKKSSNLRARLASQS